jgi:hypothetical protein
MTTPVRYPARILGAALALGWAFDLLFYGQLPGLSVALFVLLLVGTLYAVARREGVTPRLRNLWLMLPLAFFAAMVAVHSDAGLTTLNILACLLILVLLAYYYSAGNFDRLGITGYYLALCISAFNAMFRAAPLVPASIELRTIRRRGGISARTAMPILRGLLLALPIAIVFTALLASADTIFATWVGAIFSLNLSFIPSIQEAMWHVVLVLTVAWLVAGGIAFALSRASASETEPWEDALQSIPRTMHLGFVESAVILVVVDLIFALFGWIQFSYLFGGSINIASEGYTYADYARRGFFELLVVSLLTLMLVLGLHNFTWRETARQSLVFKTLASVMVALTGILLASALYRMLLYEEAYGFTGLRLYVQVFEIWLAVMFGWLLFTMWKPSQRFAIGAFVVALGFLATMNIINPDATIVQQNFARYHQTGRIDIDYLATLSDDAIPALLSSSDQLPAYDRDLLIHTLQAKRDYKEDKLDLQSITSFNISRWQAQLSLQGTDQHYTANR